MENGKGRLLDERCILQVLGCLMLEPTLLDEYRFEPDDFGLDFYQIIYGAIYNLYSTGSGVIDKVSIDNYLSNYKTQYTKFQLNKGMEYVNDCRELAELRNFTPNHSKLKKLAYLRYAEANGLDIRPLFDYTLEGAEFEKEQEKFDALSVDELITRVEDKFVIEAKNKYSIVITQKEYGAGSGINELLDKLEESPDYGIPLVSPFLNTIYRGARLGTFFLLSAPTGAGKTRIGIQNIVYFSIPHQYNTESHEWEYHNGMTNPSLIISTELEIEEIQPMILAQIAGVDEDKIKTNCCTSEEKERVRKAAQYMINSPLHIVVVDDFSREQVFNIIRKYHREYDVDYVYFDYIQLSDGLMSEMAKMKNMRGDQILYQFVSSLKLLARKLNIFLISATQVSGSYHEGARDETILRGAKAMADKVDGGEIVMDPSPGELKAVESIIPRKIGMKMPNKVKHIYKCRGGKYTKIKIFCYLDLGKMTLDDLFVTDANNVVIDIPYTNISVSSLENDDLDTVEQIIQENSIEMNKVSEEEVYEKLNGQINDQDNNSEANMTETQLAMKRLGF